MKRKEDGYAQQLEGWPLRKPYSKEVNLVSKTASVGVVGPGYWLYVSSILARRLTSIIDKGNIVGDEIPVGILTGAKRFLDMALDAVAEGVPANPPASINAYQIAGNALHAATSNGETPSDLPGALKSYVELLPRLRTPGSLSESERARVGQLRAFFEQLRDEGVTETYENVAEPMLPMYRY